jgi:hypothetical protein
MDQYLKKAHEARKQAARDLSAGIKAHLLTIASDYETLARATAENERLYHRSRHFAQPIIDSGSESV